MFAIPEARDGELHRRILECIVALMTRARD